MPSTSIQLNDIVELDAPARFFQLKKYFDRVPADMPEGLWQVVVYDPADSLTPFAITPLLGVPHGTYSWQADTATNSYVYNRSHKSDWFVPGETPILWVELAHITKVA